MMIKFSFPLFFFLSFSLSSFCQGFIPGIFGGFLESQVDGDRLSGYNKPGGTFGFIVNRDLGKRSMIQTEFEFIQKGSRKLADPAQGDNHSYQIKLNYIEVPFLFNYTFGKKFIPEAGLAFAYLLSSAEVLDGLSNDPAPKFSNFEYSCILGFNYKLFDRFRLNLRWSYSLIPIRRPGGDNAFNIDYFDRAQYNKLLSFSIYYYFFKNH